jgi:hypothetical protein
MNTQFKRPTIRDILFFVLIFVTLLLRMLLSPPIWQHGEAREGLVVQEIVLGHHWILPFRNGELPSKPPLFHWMGALAATVFGLTDFAIRLPSIIGAAIMAGATFLIGNTVGGRKTAWLGIGALLGMSEFWESATQARVDMVFAACVTVAITAFLFWDRYHGKAARATCYVACSLAVLAKGPVGIALPLLVIVGFLAVDGRIKSLWKLWSWSLAALVLCVDVGWYTLAYQIGGDQFLGQQLLYENVDRFIGTGGFSHSKSIDMMIWLTTRTLPWNLVLLWSLFRSFLGKREDSSSRFLHAWWITIFLFFAAAAGKRAVYLLPLYSAIALLAARALEDMIETAKRFPRHGFVQEVSSSEIGRRNPARPAIYLGIAIAVFDLTTMLGSTAFWKDANSRNARLAFVQQIDEIVPNYRPLFATADFSKTNLMVFAYRLEREIDIKPIACAGRIDYFLSPLGSRNPAGVDTRVMASLKSEKAALITVLSGKSGSGKPERTGGDPGPFRNLDHQCAR